MPTPLAREERSIKQELEDIRHSIDLNTRAQKRRSTLQWIALGAIAIVGFLGYNDDRSDDQREKDRVEKEQLQDCVSGMEGRKDAEDRLVDLAHNLGAEDSAVNAIHESYDSAEPLPACVRAADSGKSSSNK
jgi:hypothetical protein